MNGVFISHVEEDTEIALEIALGLEEAGYTTWCYEVDNIPGLSYLIQTGQAVEEAQVLLLVISPHALGSSQVTKEVIRAHETNKVFIPVLRDISHVEFQNRQPEWREALGSASSIRIPKVGVADIIPRIIIGLKASGILPKSKPKSVRINQINQALKEVQEYSVPAKAGKHPFPTNRPEPEPIAVGKMPAVTARAANDTKRQKKWLKPVLVGGSVIVGLFILWIAATQIYSFLERSDSQKQELTSTQTPMLTSSSTATPSPSTVPEPVVTVTFPDENLRSTIYEAILKTTGPIYASDLESLTTLVASGKNISNLSGLEYCVNLKVLHIYQNNISDLTPLAGLTNLRELIIYQNSISDITPLSEIVGLEQLWLGRNKISDISPLRGLKNLTILVLIYNEITDILPLVENNGLSSGDIVNLADNPLSDISLDTHVPMLLDRGVTVFQ